MEVGGDVAEGLLSIKDVLVREKLPVEEGRHDALDDRVTVLLEGVVVLVELLLSVSQANYLHELGP